MWLGVTPIGGVCCIVAGVSLSSALCVQGLKTDVSFVQGVMRGSGEAPRQRIVRW